MDKKVLEAHKVLIYMIHELLEGSIRYEYLLDIVLKTKYNRIKSKAAFSRLITKLKKANILKEKTDYDFKKRLYLNKPIVAIFKGVKTKDTSAVSLKASTRIKSNFKARYFIENYVDTNENLSLESLVDLALKSKGNLFNSNEKKVLNRLLKAFDNSLTDEAFKRILAEYDTQQSVFKKQLQALKQGPEMRKYKAKQKANNIDVGEEYDGDPIPKPITTKRGEGEEQKVVSLQRLKKNNVYLADIFMKDLAVTSPYSSSIKKADGGAQRYATNFNFLETKQVTLKFVYFCSTKDLKTSKIRSLYDDVKTYADSLTVKDIVTTTVASYIKANHNRLIKYDSRALSIVLGAIQFNSQQVVKVVAELDVIFMNEINFNRSMKRISKHKELTSQITPVSHDCSSDYKIKFRHYNFYPMNEHDPI